MQAIVDPNRRVARSSWAFLLVVGGLGLPGETMVRAAEAEDPAAVEFFEKQVRPLLIEHCGKCHAGETSKGGLRVDSRAALLTGGDTGPAIVPGEPDQSLLIEAIRYAPEGYQMPPTGKLPDEAIATLTEWVRQGAVWPGTPESVDPHPGTIDLAARAQHWSFQPVVTVTIPDDATFKVTRTPIDRFIGAKLQAAGLAPSPETDRRTWLRRVTYDLIGLPPTPEELVTFEQDDRPDAYEQTIERLLASPHYGERWGRHWLDLVRFAETGGHEFDFEIPYAAPYRDYIIRAFNQDLPYDRLVREHLAGDLLPAPRRDPATGRNESVIGTAFYWFGQGKHSPVDLRAEECDTVDNQIDVLGKTFQGLTIACARCHDHKFDPILQRDYYALAGFLQSSRQTIADTTPPEAIDAVVGDLRTQSRRSIAPVLKQVVAAADRFVALLPRRLLSDAADDRLWRESLIKPAGPDRTDPWHFWAHWGHTPDIPARIAGWQALRRGEAEQHAAVGPQLVWAPWQTTTEDQQSLPSWRYEGAAFAETDPSGWLWGNTPTKPLLGIASPAAWGDSGTISPRLVGTLRSPTFTITTPYLDYVLRRRGGPPHPPRQNKVGQVHLIIDGFQVIRSPLYGHLTINVEPHDQRRWVRQDLQKFQGRKAYIEIEDFDDGSFVLESVTASQGPPPAAAYNALLTRAVDAGAIETSADLATVYQQVFASIVEKLRQEATYGVPATRGPDGPAIAALINALLPQLNLPEEPSIAALLTERQAIEARLPTPSWTIGMADGTAEDEQLLIRGNPKKAGEVVPRSYLTTLANHLGEAALGPEGNEAGSGRLRLADCVADPRNPLTARVLVNRVWQQHFGRGLVPTPDDFGHMGQPPSHPELLDWLAGEFVRGGWSIKGLHRLILNSATYRQSSRLSDAATEERDPQNLLLHRMPIRRLEAEPIRDALLQLSGRLDDRLYGPGVLPHLTAFMEGRGRPGQSGPLDGGGRRSLYINVRRNFLSPLFLAFDFPTPFTTMGKRSTSNVPAQALTLMNNPFVIEQTRAWADRVTAREPDSEAAIRRFYQEGLGREPTGEELAAAQEFLAAATPEAWRDFAHILVNVKDFVFLE